MNGTCKKVITANVFLRAKSEIISGEAFQRVLLATFFWIILADALMCIDVTFK